MYFLFNSGRNNDKKVKGTNTRPKASDSKKGINGIIMIQQYLYQIDSILYKVMGLLNVYADNAKEKIKRLLTNSFQSQYE